MKEISFMDFPQHHHHQPINVPTAEAQAFLMDYPQGERAILQHGEVFYFYGQALNGKVIICLSPLCDVKINI
jgi:hypothetical protein